MINHLLAGLSAVFLMAGVASAQTYPPPTTPPEIPGSGTSTTTIISPGPNGGYHATTAQHNVDMYGNRVTRKDIYREGIAGSSETHTTTTTDPWGGSTTTRTTTTNHQ
ncbi:MAG: hypothetical protein JO007_23215 [Alphaproteobacteria bacterium]|nr:hypothetical protein [Alphaproteobacteria bacterium]